MTQNNNDMASKKLFILFSILLGMVGTKASAYDFAVKNTDGVMIYYYYKNNGTEVGVTYNTYGESYSGVVVIPEEVTYMNRTRKVTEIGAAFYNCSNLTSVIIPNSDTSIGDKAFYCCSGLTSITIPNSVTSIGKQAFIYCSSLKSITIPNSVTRIGEWAFYGWDLLEVVSKVENPFKIPTSTFSDNTFYNITLYVPVGTIDKYKATDGWKKFLYIEEGTGSGGGTETTKCENPTVSYKNGKLTFTSATDGATCYSSISDSDIKSYSSNEVDLSVTYNISVYAAKAGYENSETVTATLCWIDADPKTEGITDGKAEIPAKAILIQNNGSTLTIQGADDGTAVSVYGVNGTQSGSAISNNGSAMVTTNLQPGSIAIVKIGEKSVKVVLK